MPTDLVRRSLRGFAEAFKTSDGPGAPPQIAIEAPVQPIADATPFALYAGSPGLQDGWFGLLVVQEHNSAGASDITTTVNVTPEMIAAAVERFDPAGGFVAWMYPPVLEITGSLNVDNFIGARISTNNAGVNLDAAVGAPIRNIGLFKVADITKLRASNASPAWVQNCANQVWPVPIIATAAGTLVWTVESGVGDDMFCRFHHSFRILPRGVPPFG